MEAEGCSNAMPGLSDPGVPYSFLCGMTLPHCRHTLSLKFVCAFTARVRPRGEVIFALRPKGVLAREVPTGKTVREYWDVPAI